MKKSIVVLIFVCFAVSIAAVITLFAMSGIMKDRRGSFLRQFPPHPALDGKSFNIKHSSYYIAGGTPHHIYLGNHKAPLHVLILNMALTDTQHVRLNVKGIHDHKFRSLRLKVDSPYYYLSDGTVPIIFRGNVVDLKAEKYSQDTTYFNRIAPMDNGEFAVQSLSGETGEYMLGRISSQPPYHSFNRNILQKQLDGVFCTSGMLHYNKELKKIVYLYYYRNEFMVMDTNLNLLYRGNTIDTTSRAKIKPATIESENAKTLSSPPLFVNKGSDAAGNWLFVNSTVLAKNQPEHAFEEGSIIDMYDLRNGRYAFSFYIYDLLGREKGKNKQKMKEFMVFGDKMIIRYDDAIQVYQLRPKYFASNEISER